MKSGICSTYLTVLLSFLLSLSVIARGNTDIVGVDNDLGYPDTDDFDETGIQKRRLSSFVRIGRGLSSFVRIGKNGLYAPIDEVGDGDVDDYGNEGQGQRNGAFGKGYANKRLSSFVRIGRGMNYPRDNEKRAGAFIRVGKFPSSGYYRSRYSGNVSPYYRRTGRIGHSSFIRIGKRDTSNTLNDQKISDELYKRYLDLERQLGEGNSDIKTEDKKMSSFVRIGRPSSFVRIGRPSSFEGTGQDDNGFAYDDGLGNEEQKRMSHFVRIGKNKELLNDAILKRRLSNFVRIGRQPDLNDIGGVDDNAFGEDVKRRMSSFVRIGKSVNPDDGTFGEDVKRRMSSFVRIGKSVNTDGKTNGLELETDIKDQNEAGLQ